MRIRTAALVSLLACLALAAALHWQTRRQAARQRRERAEQRVSAQEADEMLSRKVELHGGEVSLQEFADLLHEQTGYQFEIDARLKLWYATTGGEEPQLWRLRLPQGSCTLRTALKAGLAGAGITYDLNHRRVTFIEPDHSSDLNDRYVETYPLPHPPGAVQVADADEWIEALTTTVGSSSWAEVGGSGEVSGSPGSLAILQTPANHRRIQRFLDRCARLESPPKSLAPIPLTGSATSEQHQRLLAALDQPSRIDCMDLPLETVLTELGRSHGIPVLMHYKKLQEAAVDPQTPVTVRVDNVSLRSLLHLLLPQFELTYVIEDGELWITTPDDANSPDNELVVAYPVHSLVEPGGDFDPLIELITTMPAPNSWPAMTGPGPIAGGPVDGYILVPQSQDVHREIAAFLSRLSDIVANGPSDSSVVEMPQTAREREVRELLNRPIKLDIVELPLPQALDKLSDQIDVSIVISYRQLDQAAINADQPVTCVRAEAPAKEQLRALLAPLELTFAIDNEVIEVFPPYVASFHGGQQIRLFDTRVLSDPDLGIAPQFSLVEMVQNHIAPQTWDETGGPGSIDEIRSILVVSHVEGVLDQVETFVAGIERHCRPKMSPVEAQPQIVPLTSTAPDRELEARLLQPIDVSIFAQPVMEAVRQIASQHNLPLHIDRQSVAKKLSSKNELVDLNVESMTIAGVLDRLLEPRELGYHIHHGTLHVGSQYRVDELRDARLYHVAGLKPPPYSGFLPKQTLLDWIVQSDSLRPFDAIIRAESIGNDWILVSGTTSQHLRVSSFLNELRTGEIPLHAVERSQLDDDISSGVTRRQVRMSNGLPEPTTDTVE